MDKNKKIMTEVEKTLSLLDNVNDLEPNPFLYTRIKAKIDSHKNEKVMLSSDFTIKVLRQIVIALLFLFNLYSVVSYLSDNSLDEQTRQTYIKNIASEYSLDTESDYFIYYESKE